MPAPLQAMWDVVPGFERSRSRSAAGLAGVDRGHGELIPVTAARGRGAIMGHGI
jgi:hypothetical protein